MRSAGWLALGYLAGTAAAIFAAPLRPEDFPEWTWQAEVTAEVPLDRLRAGTMTDEEALHVAAKTLRLLNHPHAQEHGPEVLQALSERLERVRLAAPEQKS